MHLHTCQPPRIARGSHAFRQCANNRKTIGYCIENNRRTIECQNVTHFDSNKLATMQHWLIMHAINVFSM